MLVLVFVIGLWPAMWFWPLVRNQIEPRTTGFRINLNRADATTLALLQGIGPQLARNIVDDRCREGMFRNLEELLLVSQVGPKTITEISPFVVCRSDDS